MFVAFSPLSTVASTAMHCMTKFCSLTLKMALGKHGSKSGFDQILRFTDRKRKENNLKTSKKSKISGKRKASLLVMCGFDENCAFSR